MMAKARAKELVNRFPACRVGVLGDLILDRYVWGSVDRISPEAPVPVVRVERESTMLGGAGNVARNLASLGARAELAAVVGEDDSARELHRLCARWKIDTSGIITEPSRPTSLKTRVIARAQQVVRYDRETEQPIGATSVEGLLDGLRTQALRLDGVIIEDYGKGLLTPEVMREAMAIFAERDLRVFVDPKESDWGAYGGAELVKPNLREAERLTGIRVRGDSDLERLGQEVLSLTRARTVAVTRGEAGMSLFSSEDGVQHVPTASRAVADVAGAGDTAIAALALARLCHASWVEAAELANAAAGFVVGVPGTATLTQQDLLDSLRGEA
jgi:D-beta-D-heptose 7-phosphate kinase/D-beta-D-heptose 1-phosphate adenosyltransferase